MIDKSIRQYYDSGMLVKPGEGRPGYAGKKKTKEEFAAEAKKAWADLEAGKGLSEAEIEKGWTSEDRLNKQLDELGINRMEVQNEIDERRSNFKWDGKGDLQMEFDKIGINTKKEYVEKAGFEKGKEMIGGAEFVPTQEGTTLKKLKEIGSEFMLNRHRITTQDIKDVKKGDATILEVTKRILKRYIGMGEEEKGQGLNLAPKKISSVLRAAKTGKGALDFFTGSKSLVKLFAPAAVAGGIAYLHKNREKFTGYATQKGYEDARDIRVLEKRQTDMLDRMKRGDKYSEKNLIQVTNELAKKRGDVDADDMAFIKEITGEDEPSWEGINGYPDKTKDVIKAPTDIVQFPGENEMILQQREQEQRNRLAEQREQERLQREVTRQAEENAARIAAEQAAAAPPPQLAQPQGGGGRDYGQQETRSSSGWERSPFKKGGRIDKTLEGRNRDI